MSFNRFTSRAKRVAELSQEIARTSKSPVIGTEHMLIALLGEGGGIAAQALSDFGATPNALYNVMHEKSVGKNNKKGFDDPKRSLEFNKDATKALSNAARIAVSLQKDYIGVEHLLLGILDVPGSFAVEILLALRIKPEELVRRIHEIISSWNDASDSQNIPEGYSHDADEIAPREENFAGMARPKLRNPRSTTLDSFAHNLTQDAQEGLLDPVIGRTEEMERLMQILGRRTKNNPVLIGDPGVGKSAIIEGLAQKIVQGSVPEMLKDKQIYSLDLAAMIAGTRYRGDFEERLKKTIKEVQNRGDVILFLDEMHILTGAGGTGDGGGTDAANILKPLLARGELRLIGATTVSEYRKYIEKDAALERRFQPIQVMPPTKEETIAILNGIRDKYASHHKVKITDEAIEAAVTLAIRYIPDRNLPDKAIDIIDEAGARSQIQRFTKSPEIVEIDAKIIGIRKEKEDAVSQQNFDKAGLLRKEELSLSAERARISKENKDPDKETIVTADTIADVVTSMTGIPVGKVNDSDNAALRNIEAELHSRVIGQDQAISALSRAIRRTRAGLKDPKRPGGSFIFAGPTGVGKSELAKALAEFLHGTEDALITLDMSEYAEQHSVSRLFGSPPGYVGHDEGGQLTEKVRRKPFSVILFDEMEKAHPDLSNTLLQILDEGKLTDAQGRTIDFKNTIIIMTTNLGSRDVAKANYMGFSSVDSGDSYDRLKSKVNDELKQYFRPEFLNRIDDTIVFKTLTMSEIVEIVDMMTGSLNKRLASKDMELEVTLKAREHLATIGYDQAMGARPLRRVVQREIEDALSERILSGSINPGDLMLIDYDDMDSKLTFTTHLKNEITLDLNDIPLIELP